MEHLEGRLLLTSVTGAVFGDDNLNGIRDPGEGGLFNWRVFADINGNGIYNSGEPTTLSGALGAYTIPNVPAGPTTIRLVVPDGWLRVNPGDASHAVDVPASGTLAGLDFALLEFGSISGIVFHDINGDGIHFAEGGLDEQIVFLDDNENSQLDPGERFVTTDDLGAYSFTELLPDTYHLRVIVPDGWIQTQPIGAIDQLLREGQNLAGRKIGVAELGSISGVAFHDDGGDGVRDLAEAGLADWMIYLDANGNGAFDDGEPTTLTTATGAYTFANLAPGAYRVRQVIQEDYYRTLPAAGSYLLTLTSGQNASAKDFGNARQGSVEGTVFSDANADGNLNGADAGIAGRRIFVDLDRDTLFDFGEPSALTDAEGNYRIDDIPAGNQLVRVESQAGWRPTSPADGLHDLNIPSGQVRSNADFGMIQLASVAGTVFDDLNRNGIIDSGESPLEGWIVFLDSDGDGQLDAGELQATTAADGSWTFPNLLPGEHDLAVISPSGWSPTLPSAATRSTTLDPGEHAINLNFGFALPNSIGGRLFNDRDGNGFQSPDEPFLAGRKIFIDLNGNGVFNAGEPQAITDSDGAYLFEDLAAGRQTVVPRAVKGWRTSVIASRAFTLTGGTNVTGAHFAVTEMAAVVGRSFRDLNGNGKRDADEKWLANTTVFVDRNGNGRHDKNEPTSTTDRKGFWYFIALPSGSNTIRALPRPGLTPTTPLRLLVKLRPGQILRDEVFAFRTTPKGPAKR